MALRGQALQAACGGSEAALTYDNRSGDRQAHVELVAGSSMVEQGPLKPLVGGSSPSPPDLLDRIEAIADREVTKLEAFSASDIVLDGPAISKLSDLVKVISLARQESRLVMKELRLMGPVELAAELAK